MKEVNKVQSRLQPTWKCHTSGKEEETSPKICWYSIRIDFQIQEVKTGYEDQFLETFLWYLCDGDWY